MVNLTQDVLHPKQTRLSSSSEIKFKCDNDCDVTWCG